MFLKWYIVRVLERGTDKDLQEIGVKNIFKYIKELNISRSQSASSETESRFMGLADGNGIFHYQMLEKNMRILTNFQKKILKEVEQ